MSDIYAATHGDATSTDIELLSQFCRMEKWSADLSTGLFAIGPLARENHGLSHEDDCGLLTLIRCYRKGDRQKVLEILESASVSPSRFCITTETIIDNGDGTSIICIGESQDFTEAGAGSIEGVFLFPRLSSVTNNIVIPMIRQ